MKLAFVFPGQGSQSVGMLDSFRDDPTVRAVLARADAALEQDLSGLMARGPAEELSLTVNTQPAMLVAGYAIYAAWRAARGPEPVVLAGHSLGEYTALTVAGALPFEAAVQLVRFRAARMQDAVAAGEGAMAAILGLPDAEVVAACAEAAAAAGAGAVVEAVNFNAPAQVVIAGHRGAVDRACEAARARGAKRAVILAVSAPFHSSLMAPAAAALRTRLAAVALAAPHIAVINNIDVATISDPAGIRDALARQAAGPVHWAQIVRKMGDAGVTHLVECGPGKVLARLTRRIDERIQGFAVADAASLRDTIDRLKAFS